MPPQKRSIRDFFAPAQKGTPPSQPLSPKQPAPKITPVSRAPPSTASRPQIDGSAQDLSPPRSPSPSYPTIGDTIHVATSRTTVSDSRPPSTSQSSANSAGTSKRVLSNGEPVVLNSDSDSDDLPEFDFGELLSKPNPKSTVTRLKDKDAAKKDVLRKPPSNRKEGDSFTLFVQKAQQHAETERKIAQFKADLEKPITEDAPSTEFDISEEALADAVNDEEDPEKAKRLYLAMQRTNALHSDCVFHFFDESLHSATKGPSFPMDALPNHRWTSSFQEEPARDEAFLSGFAGRVFQYQQLPEELASWMIDQLCTSRNDCLNDRYIQLLHEHNHHLQTLLDRVRLDALFTRLGANSQCLNPRLEVAPSYEPHPAPTRTVPSSLKWVCRLLQTAAPRLQAAAGSHAFYALVHLCMDHSVNSDVETLLAVQDAIEAVLCSVDKLPLLLNEVVPLLLKRTRHPVLQRNLVRSMPARSSLTAYFQRYLALSFLLHPKALDTALGSPEVAVLLRAHLEDSSDFHINKNTNYMYLSARLALLDIAIGPGPLVVPYYPLMSPVTSQYGSSPVTVPGPQSSEEKAFNAEVDALAQITKRLSSSIVETGALSDLSRLEAKECSERMYHRLENAVRIGGKKLIDIFGNSDEVNGIRMMSQWLGSGGKSGSQTPAVMRDVNANEGEPNTDIAMEA